MPGLPAHEGGVLWVKGDNVMLGYMRADKPGVLEAPSDSDLGGEESRNWYDTGDIVRVDAEDFVYIQGRAKRFAKVGGEMISLAAVENALREMWPETVLGVVAVPDSRKGEQLALILEKDQVNAGSIAASFASRGLSPLWTPRRIICVKHAPLLGSGKFDYSAARQLAIEEST
jgi:acyl-[acyl-carrier-protein]-phospholipid O-acyltransferase/long-chain-fatty-acid--[acyl-carrier-protein] ligase